MIWRNAANPLMRVLYSAEFICLLAYRLYKRLASFCICSGVSNLVRSSFKAAILFKTTAFNLAFNLGTDF